VARKKLTKIYNYECSLTWEQFKLGRKVDNPDELVSVKAYYELHPEMDDRPEHIKAELAQKEQEEIDAFDELAQFAVDSNNDTPAN